MLACYGAGTPDTSAYRHWLRVLSQINEFEGPATAVLKGLPKAGERPFIAAIPQAVLQNPEGPLAFLGHIDLAWTYSFTELDSGSAMDRPGKFIQIVADLLKGNRVGIALRSLMLALGSANTELTTLYDRQASGGNAPLSPAGEARRGHLWMLRQTWLPTSCLVILRHGFRWPQEARRESSRWLHLLPVALPPRRPCSLGLQ